MNDSQRQKAYDAEGIAFDADGTPRLKYRVGDGGIADAQKFVDAIFASAFLREKYEFTKAAPLVVPGVGQRKRGCYKWAKNEIHLPEWTRQNWYVLHECAHAFVPKTPTRPAHGWEWAACYLDLVRVYMGRGYEEKLIAAFRAKRVKFKSPRKQTISDAERERRREHGRSLHA